jgi:hypothetical protein
MPRVAYILADTQVARRVTTLVVAKVKEWASGQIGRRGAHRACSVG